MTDQTLEEYLQSMANHADHFRPTNTREDVVYAMGVRDGMAEMAREILRRMDERKVSD